MADQQAYNPPQQQPYQHFPGYQPAPGQFPSQQTQIKSLQPYAYGATGTFPVVVSAQPTPVATTFWQEQEYSEMAACAFVFSLITLICCGASLLCLTCSVPALILAIMAMGTTGSSQKNNAIISIALNVGAVVGTVLVLVILIPTVVVAGSCSSYYSYTHHSHCFPYSYGSYYCTYYCD